MKYANPDNIKKNPRTLITLAEPPFYTIQGEGHMIGQPTVFVRSAGCDSHCKWCDSLHAVDRKLYGQSWFKLDSSNLLQEVVKTTKGVTSDLWITLSGGNPAIQPFETFIEMAKKAGYKVCCETQGSVFPEWFFNLDHLSLSPKPPSAEMDFKFAPFLEFLDTADYRGLDYSVKIVVTSPEDLLFAKRIADQCIADIPIYLTPGNETPPNNPVNPSGEFNLYAVTATADWLTGELNKMGWFKPRVIIQQHTVIWGNQAGK
jgi:7-carboxy-7-deazaguanine synthase